MWMLLLSIKRVLNQMSNHLWRYRSLGKTWNRGSLSILVSFSTLNPKRRKTRNFLRLGIQLAVRISLLHHTSQRWRVQALKFRMRMIKTKTPHIQRKTVWLNKRNFRRMKTNCRHHWREHCLARDNTLRILSSKIIHRKKGRAFETLIVTNYFPNLL